MDVLGRPSTLSRAVRIFFTLNRIREDVVMYESIDFRDSSAIQRPSVRVINEGRSFAPFCLFVE
jgi:hypothetical protein